MRRFALLAALAALLAFVSPAQAETTLKVSPQTVAPGGQVTVDFSDSSPGPMDWVDIFRAGSSNSKYSPAWQYAACGCQTAPSTAKQSGTLTFTAPEAGSYELRYLADDGFESVASAPLEVNADTHEPISAWRPVGSDPLSDADAAARVKAMPERRPGNAVPNSYVPSAAEVESFRNRRDLAFDRTMVDSNPLLARVTGGFSGTTDEIVQWVAHKWGIPEDVIRAVMVRESRWRQGQMGDRQTVPDPWIYPAHSRIEGTSDVYASLGIIQVRWDPNTHWGTEPLRWQSTAFNLDYWAATVRYYFDGDCYWCGGSYASGQEWPSVGGWFDPSDWPNGSAHYQHDVWKTFVNRTWEQPGF